MAEARPPADEAPLLAALREGDEAAFLALVQRYNSSMVRLALAFVRSDAVAQEVAQETWLAVLEGVGKFEGRSSLRSWIFSILSNRARTRAQREARSPSVSSIEEAETPAVDQSRFFPPDHAWFPDGWCAPPSKWADDRLLMRETLTLLRGAIEALPPAQRQVILLRDVEGCSAEEVCAALGVSDANQRVLLHRARSRVRGLLEPHLTRPS
jgi:RNA polymerase sigma-70 factor (ECF subfamily)